MKTTSTTTSATCKVEIGDLLTADNGLVIMVSNPHPNTRVSYKAIAGTVVNVGISDWELGHHSESWAADSFKFFHGIVTLKSE